MTAAPLLIIEDRLREKGWFFGTMDRVGERWQHARYPNDGYSIEQACFLEWQEQQARAGHAEHHLRELKHKLTVLCLSLAIAATAAITFVGGMSLLK